MKAVNLVLSLLLFVIGLLSLYDVINYWILVAAAVYQLIYYLNKKLRWGLTQAHLFFILLLVYLGIASTLFDLYGKFVYHDKLLHFIVPLVVTYIIADSKFIKRKYVLVAFMLGLSVLHEMYEFYFDLLFGTSLQGVSYAELFIAPLEDTMYDLTLGFFGSLIGVLIYYLKNSRLHK